MNILSKFRKFFTKSYETRAYMRGFYEGSKVTGANKDFWNVNTDFETIATPERNILRARARWLSANNPIMDNIDNAIINNCIGTGITLQSRTGNDKFNKQVETEFKKWATDKSQCDVAGRFTFYDLQRLILKSRMVDGEIFIYKKITESGLQLQLIEADALDVSRMDGGIELDSVGRPVKYHFLDYNNKQFSIDAEHIINYFMATRATQVRGVTEYTQAILDLKNFSAFQSASIEAARARANIAYAVKQNGQIDPLGVDINNRIQTINGVSVLYLNHGDDISKLDPDSVATDYVQFSENTIRLIATARKVSYELAFKDYSKVNFASSRASLLQDYKRFDLEQQHLENYILNDIFKTWLQLAVLSGKINQQGVFRNPDKWIKPKWIMPKRDLVDPLKEITALEKKIKLNITTETDVANADGEDYEDLLRKKANEIKLKEKYGIPDYTLIPGTSSGDANNDGKVDFDENLTGAESHINKE